MSHTLENHGNHHKTTKDKCSLCCNKVDESRAEAKRLSQTNNEASTEPPKMIMTDNLKQMLMTANNQ